MNFFSSKSIYLKKNLKIYFLPAIFLINVFFKNNNFFFLIKKI